jgi:hypothetical protein
MAVSEADLPEKLRELASRHEAFRLDAGKGLRCGLFRDDRGTARVLFVTNTTSEPRTAVLSAPYLQHAVDALDGDVFRATVRALEVPLSPHSVRMLELK